MSSEMDFNVGDQVVKLRTGYLIAAGAIGFVQYISSEKVIVRWTEYTGDAEIQSYYREDNLDCIGHRQEPEPDEWAEEFCFEP